MVSFILEMFLSTVLGGFAAKWLIPGTSSFFYDGTWRSYNEASLTYCMLAALVCFLLNAGAKTWMNLNDIIVRRLLGNKDGKITDTEYNMTILLLLIGMDTVVVQFIANNMTYTGTVNWLSSFVTAVALMAIPYVLTFVPLVARVSGGER